jgi:hypothetical protein
LKIILYIAIFIQSYQLFAGEFCPPPFRDQSIANKTSEVYCVGDVNGYVTGPLGNREHHLPNQLLETSYKPSINYTKYINACIDKFSQGYTLVSYSGRPRCFNLSTQSMPDPEGYLTGIHDAPAISRYADEAESIPTSDEGLVVLNTDQELQLLQTPEVPQTPEAKPKDKEETELTPCPSVPRNNTCFQSLISESLNTQPAKHTCISNDSECERMVGVAKSASGSSDTTKNAVYNVLSCSGNVQTCALKKAANCDSGDEECQRYILEMAEDGLYRTAKAHIEQVDIKAPINKADRVADKKQCDDSQEEATQCCGDILACVTGKPEIIGQILSGVTQISNAARAGQINSIAKHCEQLKNISDVGTFTALASSGVCKSSRDMCKDTCEPTKEKYEELVSIYSDKNCSSGRSVKALSLRLDETFMANCKINDKYEDTLARLETDIGICSKLEQKQDAHVAQSVKTAIQGQLARDCQERVAEQATGLPVDETAFNGDCTNPINATNPTCLFCREASNRSAVQCTGLLLPPPPTAFNTDNGGGRGLANVGGRPELGGDSYSDDDGDDLVEGDVISAVTGGAPASNPGIGGGGTGGPQMSGDSGGGMGAAGGGGSGGGAGYKTNILRGARGGGGYTSNVAVSSGGGFRGYKRNGAGKFDQKKRFSLKDYLPSTKSKPKNSRSIANLGKSKNPEIGGAHTDIFHRVSMRYTAICRLKRLLDCK